MGSAAVADPQFSGDLYERGAGGYQAAREAAVWNGRKPDRFPDEILIAANADDVVAGVRRAASRGQKIGIRSGGHSFVATGIRDGGLLIDLSHLKDVEIDKERMTAWIGAGVCGRDLGSRLPEEDLAFPYGGSPTVGLGGFLLTGGYGLNGKTFGSGASNIKAIDVVTADGELIHADENENSDYLWAARGGGYGFPGVVVRFELHLHDAPRHPTRASFNYAAEDFEELAEWLFANKDLIDRKLMTLVFGLHPADLDQKVVRIAALGFGDSEEETRSMFRPLEEAPLTRRAVAREAPRTTTIEEIWAGVDLLYPKGSRYFADTVWIDDVNAPGLAAALGHSLDTLPPGGSHVMMNPWIPEERDMALSGTTALPFHLYGVGTRAEEDVLLQDWINGGMEKVLPFSSGVGKINESNLLIRDQHVLAPENEAKLEDFRSRFDPEGRFHTFLRAEAMSNAG